MPATVVVAIETRPWRGDARGLQLLGQHGDPVAEGGAHDVDQAGLLGRDSRATPATTQPDAPADARTVPRHSSMKQSSTSAAATSVGASPMIGGRPRRSIRRTGLLGASLVGVVVDRRSGAPLAGQDTGE